MTTSQTFATPQGIMKIFLWAYPQEVLLALCRIAKAWACYKGREYVVPQDVRDFFVHVCSHRISLSAKGRLSGLAAESVLDEILKKRKMP